jgi:hypothetical protein
MDVAMIAQTAITILAPYLAKAGEEVAKKSREAAGKKAEAIYQAIKTRFQKEKDDYPLQTLERFEENPEKRKATIQEVLEEILDKDPDFAQLLFTLLKKADEASGGAVFNVNIFGGEVGQVINVDELKEWINHNEGAIVHR